MMDNLTLNGPKDVEDKIAFTLDELFLWTINFDIYI